MESVAFDERLNQWRIHCKGLLLRPRQMVKDARLNAAWCRAGERILVVRHSGKHPTLQSYYLDWLAKNFPETRALFELRLLPCDVTDWSRYRLFIPWFQDPAKDWMTPGMYAAARRLEDQCDARGIAIVNRVEVTANCMRSVAAAKLEEAGIRTPRVVPIHDHHEFLRDLGGLQLPLIVRENRGHGKSVVLVRRRDELNSLRWNRMQHPIAVEYADVASPRDGMFRKCRFVVAGMLGVRRHLIVSQGWEVRATSRVAGESTRDEELAFLTGEPVERDVLDRARRCLELDWAAFDYSFDKSGEIVVWETNPYPNLSFPTGSGTGYTHPFVERSFAAMTHLYLTAAGMRVPDGIAEKLLTAPTDAMSPASANAA